MKVQKCFVFLFIIHFSFYFALFAFNTIDELNNVQMTTFNGQITASFTKSVCNIYVQEAIISQSFQLFVFIVGYETKNETVNYAFRFDSIELHAKLAQVKQWLKNKKKKHLVNKIPSIKRGKGKRYPIAMSRSQ